LVETKFVKISWNSRFLVCLSLLIIQTGFFGQTQAAPAPSTGLAVSNNLISKVAQATGVAPVLLIYNDAFSNVFSKFLGEIMKAEGFNSFDTTQLSSVTASTLSTYDTVVLAQTSLTTTQASMFSTYVQNGGNLIAMRPDSKLAPTMGLGTPAGSLNNAYLAIQTDNTYGQGFVADSLQLHTTGDQYSGVTAQKVALLYSNAASPTIYPAVTLNNFGNGKAIAFTYDLPTSVVYTRQGNPALANMQQLFNDGKLGVVQAVSYPKPNFSHFRATDIWIASPPIRRSTRAIATRKSWPPWSSRPAD